ncbi:uncharacterized protein MELLADRAFT_91944 [Melampsora larici-populina 98AG31]|uniref:Uncharacterized protein n=1 Tax=Melampsora larici-populina (strain 98AG31 / pathotype 3-4-7) TaxID=747676 RepID=F4S0Z5_MELLP|nr:uncharacterized protein MELLADRAFT_91944 [Melampsora larici-populina 98AG31]EGG01677.1 hypothetical protein MELLADRAFT_91944 [Melampsora larici-populina 98AG31]
MKRAQLERDQVSHVIASLPYTKESQTIGSSVDSQKNSFHLVARRPTFSERSDNEPRHPFTVTERDPPRALLLSSSSSNNKTHYPSSHSQSNDRISQCPAPNFDKRNYSLTQSVSFLPPEVSSSFPDILQRTQAWASASANSSHSLKNPKKVIISSTSVKAVAFEFERNHIQKARDSVELNLKQHSRSSSRSSFSRWTEVPRKSMTLSNSDSTTDISYSSTYYPTSPGNKFFESSSANAPENPPSEEEVEIISSPNLSRGSHIDMDAPSFLHFDSPESVFVNQGSEDLKLSMSIKYPIATTSDSLTTSPLLAASHEKPNDCSSQSLLINTSNISQKLTDDHASPCSSEDSSPTFHIPGHFSADAVSVVEDEVEDDWEDAEDDDALGANSTPVNYINTALQTYNFAAPASSSYMPDATKPIQELICVEVKRRSLTSTQNRHSPHIASTHRPKLRNSVVSMLSIASRSSAVSLGATDDGGEFEDADDEAEWMDIDGGGAYEDLDKAQEITREVSRQLIIDTAQALQKATEARHRYSALTEAHHANDVIYTPMAGPLSKRTSTQVPKDFFSRYDGVPRSNSITSSSAVSSRGSRLSDRCDCEVHDRCGCSSPSSQPRDSVSSRGSRSSRVMLFTRNSKPTWVARSEEAGELGPIVEVENGSDEHTRVLSESPSTLESSPSQGSVDPLTGQPRWRPRPLFLKPARVKTPPGPAKRSIHESPSGSSSDNDPTNGRQFSRQHRQLSKSPSFYSAKESTIHGSAPSPRPTSSESSATSISRETAMTQSEVLWPFPPSTSSSSPAGSSHLNVRIAQSPQDTTTRVSPEGKMYLSVNQHVRPHTANVTSSNPPRPFGTTPPVTLRRLQSLSSDRLPLVNLKDRKPIKYSTRSNSRAGHQSNRSKSTRIQQKNKLDLSVLPEIVDSGAPVTRARSNTLFDASSVATGLLSRSGSTELHFGLSNETDEKGTRVKSRKNILRPDNSSGWTVCDPESLSEEVLDPFARVPGVLVRPHTANSIRRTQTTSSTSSQHTHRGKRRSLTGADSNNASQSDRLERLSLKKISASATNLREYPSDGYRPDSSLTDEVGQGSESGSEDLSRPAFPTRPVRPLRMDEDPSAAQDGSLDKPNISPRERSQTFGRHPRNNPSHKPPVMVLQHGEHVELPLPTGVSMSRSGVDGSDRMKHHFNLHRGVPVSPISPPTPEPGRDEGPMKNPVSRPSSGGLQPGLPHSPREISYNLKDSSPSQLSLWPSWSGGPKSPQTEPSPSPTLSTSTSTYTFHSSSRARLYSHGNSTVMESAYEVGEG